MKLTLIPQHGADGDETLAIHVAGNVLTLDGVPLDLSKGDTHDNLISATKVGKVWHATVIARLGSDAAPDTGGPWVVENARGDVEIPYIRIEVTK